MNIKRNLWVGLLILGLAVNGFADETVVYEGPVPSSGQSIEAISLKPRASYIIEVEGAMNFGVNHRNGNQLIFDACYEYNSWGRPDFVPVFKNSLGISACQGVYESAHVYKSDPFEADQELMTMNIFDTDYRDNSGVLQAKVIKVKDAESQVVSDVDFTDGFFVLLKGYQPDMSAQLPEGQKMSVYLKTVDPQAIEWKPMDSPLIMFVPNKYAQFSGRGKKWWSQGRHMLIPLSFVMTAEEEGELVEYKAEGGLLAEVSITVDTYEQVKESYPEIAEEGGRESIVSLTDAGIFGKMEEQEIGHLEMQGGPVEPSSDLDRWDKVQYERAMQFVWQVYEIMGCFIATTIYESPGAPELRSLREFRDKVLMTSDAGRRLVTYYYQLGPHWVRNMRDHQWVKTGLTPFVGVFSYALRWVDMDNEYVQRVLHSIVAIVDWIAQPWLEEESQKTGYLAPVEMLP